MSVRCLCVYRRPGRVPPPGASGSAGPACRAPLAGGAPVFAGPSAAAAAAGAASERRGSVRA